MIDYQKKFIEFCQISKNDLSQRIPYIENNLKTYQLYTACQHIIEKSYHQKGVFTVLVTLLFYKIHHPEQDIRLHQSTLKLGTKIGFSGRSFDTKYITPNLKQLGLPSMAESGWLTRSLEQAVPYSFNYTGKISGGIKNDFLSIIDAAENNIFQSEDILFFILNKTFIKTIENTVCIHKIEPDHNITIAQLIEVLEKQFQHNYKTSGGAKLPMLAFYAIYTILLKELKKFKNCYLPPINSYTASDRTSKTAGDLEIFDIANQLIEAIEIKLNLEIDLHMVYRAREKILKFNPKRYYILSTTIIKNEDKDNIQKMVEIIRKEHGCQIIINGVVDTLKYYLRLIENTESFIIIYSQLIESDKELKKIHKEYWNMLIQHMNTRFE